MKDVIINKETFSLKYNDEIHFNGHCYTLTTQTMFIDTEDLFEYECPEISEKQMKKLIKDGIVEFKGRGTSKYGIEFDIYGTVNTKEEIREEYINLKAKHISAKGNKELQTSIAKEMNKLQRLYERLK